MDLYLVVKTLHIISATILFGTGLGTAFFMFRSRFTPGIAEKLYAARNTVLADYFFTLPAVILQPATGAWMIFHAGLDWKAPWLLWTYGLYILAGICWIPVVLIQIRLRQILEDCVRSGTALPNMYRKLFRIWFALGWPAFIGLIAVFFLMVIKPS